MGRPLTPQLERIPAHMRRRIEERAASPLPNDGSKTPEQIAQMREQLS